MMFPARLLTATAALTMLIGVAAVAQPVARANPEPPPGPPLRHVQYTVFAEQPHTAEIYYRDTDPPNWGEYSHNPYLYTPNVEAEVGPGKQWNLEVWLADPDQWAMVVAGIESDSTQTPNLHCVLAVDGVVVKTAQGPKGALCSIRPW
ncbi:hypothetical protein [Mycolicibacterium agri]|uniref:Secreted protein n=1 Tax=Mycolicibacterium agri TaxID=36811 RepID=A0A7I9W1F7_MYCAG|nr:hypothetical protein MAGR_26190 [Mycolicibacterium agri]